jgi:hypothetical protein
VALVAVLLVSAIFFALIITLLVQSTTERVVAANETDHVKALGFAEAGLEWAARRIRDASTFSSLLVGPNAGSTSDDYLLGLRSLGLTAPSQFNTSNEATASAIVSRNFGDGTKNYELLRIVDDTLVRALVYVRVDDNWDDNQDNPAANAPLSDKDNRIIATAVAEYPVYVNAAGVEQANPAGRGRARRILRATYRGNSPGVAAIATNKDIDVPSSMRVCGACGSVHSNEDFAIGGSPTICVNGTASGSMAGGGTVGGTRAGGQPLIPVPVINPYDDIFVPTIDTFDTSADTSLPSGLRCPKATASDPGASKYFALVLDASKGRVYKAYWDFTDLRWEWKLIDNLDGGPYSTLDDCGRLSSDPNYGLGAAAAVSDGKNDEFYGFKGEKWETENCSGDTSFNTMANNDFTVSGHYPATGGGVTAPVLPGSFAPNSAFDVDPTKRPKNAWTYSADPIYSPLHGAVIWILGSLTISGNPGKAGSITFTCGSGAGCTSTSLPKGAWQVSIVTLGDIQLSGNGNFAPASAAKGFHFQFIAGRDLMINGNPQEDTSACGSTCSSTAPSDVATISGIYAAHEQIQTSGNPNIFGFMMAEDALDCSPMVTLPNEFNGTPQIFYDCSHPPNPWATPATVERERWQEID